MVHKLAVVIICLLSIKLSAQKNYNFVIFDKSTRAAILYDINDYNTVKLSGNLLAADIEKVTGYKPDIKENLENINGNVIIIGSVEKSRFIQSLIKNKQITDTISEKWETYSIVTLNNPFSGIEKALVILGS